MATGQYGTVLRHINRLFGLGTVSGLTEWQLLHRYVTSRDEAAFEALVARHGPMVLGVCRRLLDDPHEVEDAFQATFLVLVKKARVLRERDVLGHWLYGVAYRVALRARSDSARRHARERTGLEVVAMQPDSNQHSVDPEIRPLLDQELSRLPEKYRRPVVLCYLEGLSHEEAARLLDWPIGTVKGRLSRARELLRTRLGRRGVTVPAAILVAHLSQDASACVSSSLIDTTVQAAMTFAAGHAAAAGALSAAALALTEGVLRAMSLSKYRIAAAAVLGLGSIATGAGVLAFQSHSNGGAGNSRSQAAAPGDPTPEANARTEAISSLAAARLKAAEHAYESTKSDFEVGRVTLDRVTAMSRLWLDAQREANPKPAEQIAAFQAHLDRMRQIEKKERAELEVGRGTTTDVSEAEYYRREAELWLAQANAGRGPGHIGKADEGATEKNPSDAADLATSWVNLAQNEYNARFTEFKNGKVTVGAICQASQGLMEAERETGEHPQDQVAATAAHAKRIKQIEELIQADQAKGIEAGSDLNEIRIYRVSSEYLLAKARAGRGRQGTKADSAAPTEKDPRTQAILAKLGELIPINFPDETPLEDVIKYLREVTKGPDLPNGITFFVDPAGLQEAEKTMQSPVQMDLEGVPLGRTLDLLLRQLGLEFRVQDGFVYITPQDSQNTG
ncbi:MAG TPA: sigma-70 family RNA polymerase sigma factor, partial [Isosphaeraceae bacterium]|nr:sigma-70 family RNA polymerase sigma factor [Isosphaeraceae bacterium]